MNRLEKSIFAAALGLLVVLLFNAYFTAKKRSRPSESEISEKKENLPQPESARKLEKGPRPEVRPTTAVESDPAPIPTLDKNLLGRDGEQLWLGLYRDDYHGSGRTLLVDRVAVAFSLPLAQQVQLLGAAVSNQLFEGDALTVVLENNLKGETIAKIELGNLKKHWWQGSAQGIDTMKKIVESFLQKDLEHPWIDGLRLFRDGKPLVVADNGLWVNFEFRRRGKDIELKE